MSFTALHHSLEEINVHRSTTVSLEIDDPTYAVTHISLNSTTVTSKSIIDKCFCQLSFFISY